MFQGAWDNVLGRCTQVMLSNGKVVKLTKALQRKIEDQVIHDEELEELRVSALFRSWSIVEGEIASGA